MRDEEKLLAMIAVLENRVAALETEDTKPDVDGARERMRRERTERKAALDAQQFARETQWNAGKSRPTNPKRAEQLQRTFNELRAPVVFPPKQGVAAVLLPPAPAFRKKMPFEVTLNSETTEGVVSYRASVAPGFVIERKTGEDSPAANAVLVHEPTNIGDTFPIESAEQLIVRVEVDDKGEIAMVEGSPAVEIDVEVVGTLSTHFVPANPGEAGGTAGVYRYVLAEFEMIGGVMTTRPIMAGSHIDHWRDIPLIENTSNDTPSTDIARPYEGFDPDTNKHFFRVLDASTGQLSASEAGGNMAIRGNSKNLKVFYQIEGETEKELVAEFEDGLEISGTDAETVPELVIPIPVASSFPGGINVNLEIYRYQLTSVAVSEETNASLLYDPYIYATLYFRDGLLVARGEPNLSEPPAATGDVFTYAVHEIVIAS